MRLAQLAMVVIVILALAGFAAPPTAGQTELKVLTHDSFDIGENVIRSFEENQSATVTLIEVGDAGELVNEALLNQGAPVADLLYGVDNTFLGKALAEDLFVAYESPLLEKVPDQYQLDGQHRVTPIDYGYVNLNYDKGWMEAKNVTPPASLEELTEAAWKDKLVVMNPATSSPGLAFLLVTVDYFGENDDYDYLDFWADLRDNGVLVKTGWSDAYWTDFSYYGGDRPLIVSYATSPAAEVFYGENLTEAPTGNLLIRGASYLQVEFMGILKGAQQVELAQAFIDYALNLTFQEDFPTRMWVYPVNREAALPQVFAHAQVPPAPVQMDYERLNQQRDLWIDHWNKVVVQGLDPDEVQGSGEGDEEQGWLPAPGTALLILLLVGVAARRRRR